MLILLTIHGWGVFWFQDSKLINHNWEQFYSKCIKYSELPNSLKKNIYVNDMTVTKGL